MNRPPAEREIRIGLVGFGHMGRIYAQACRTLAASPAAKPCRVILKGVCDSDGARALNGVAAAGFEFCTTDWRDLVAHPEIDVVAVCAPTSLHRPVLLAALQAGKHVYCEAPLALNEAEAREILSAAEDSGLCHQVAADGRSLPAVIKAKELLEEGFAGRVFHFRGASFRSGALDPRRPLTWRMRKEQAGGGVLMELGPCLLDVMSYLVGDATEVCAAMETFLRERPLPEDPARLGTVEVEDAMSLLMRLRGGGIATIDLFHVAAGTQDEMRFSIQGQNGALAFTLSTPDELRVFNGPAPAARLRVDASEFGPGWAGAYTAALSSFLSAVANGQPALPDFHDALKIQHLLTTSYEASRTRQWEEI